VLTKNDNITKRERRRRATAECRARERNHQALAKTTYDDAVLDLLINTGWLLEEESTDKKLVSRAISEMVRDTARHQQNGVMRLRCPHCRRFITEPL
jgi:hypothetical protein